MTLEGSFVILQYYDEANNNTDFPKFYQPKLTSS